LRGKLIRFYGKRLAFPPWILDSPRLPQIVCTGATAISITSTNIRVKNKIIKSRLRFETRPMFGIDVAVFVFGSQISSERNSTDVWLLATNFHPLSQRMHFATSVYLAPFLPSSFFLAALFYGQYYGRSLLGRLIYFAPSIPDGGSDCVARRNFSFVLRHILWCPLPTNLIYPRLTKI